jgi:acyl-CoA thioesterase
VPPTRPAEFDHDIAVTPAGDGVLTAEARPGWAIGGALNGGYLLSVIGNALRRATDKPDPLAVSAYYLGPTAAGPVEVRTRVLRDGGSTATLAADLVQDGDPTITALATFGRLDTLPDDVGTTATEPDLPPIEECVRSSDAPEDFRRTAAILDRFDLRLDPASAGWAVGAPSGRGRLQGWLRLNDEREPDPIALLTVVDALPPVTFDLGRLGWAPTMELTAHVRARPAPGWLKVAIATRNVAGGMFEEDCEVWDSAGRLVAQSRQLARQPRG